MNTRIAALELASHPLTDRELSLMNGYWRACNYLSVGMIIDNLRYAHEHGTDRPEIANWTWPY